MHYLNLFTDIDQSKVRHYGGEEVWNRSLRINALRWYVVDFQAIREISDARTLVAVGTSNDDNFMTTI